MHVIHNYSESHCSILHAIVAATDTKFTDSVDWRQEQHCL